MEHGTSNITTFYFKPGSAHVCLLYIIVTVQEKKRFLRAGAFSRGRAGIIVFCIYSVHFLLRLCSVGR